MTPISSILSQNTVKHSPANAIAPNVISRPAAIHHAVSIQPTILFGASASPSPVQTRRVGSLEIITLNDPEHQNRLTRKMIQGMHQAIKQAEADPKVTHIVFESGMEKYFSPGADLFSDMKMVQSTQGKIKQTLPWLPKAVVNPLSFLKVLPSVRKYALDGHKMFQDLANSKKVTVALVNGYALGGGMEIALACDYAFAGPKAQFVLPETKYGIYPDWGGTERLPQRVGRSLATFLIMEGGLMPDKGIQCRATLNAEEAKLLGLVHEIIQPEGFDATAQALMAMPKYQAKGKRPDSTKGVDDMDQAIQPQIAGSRFEAIYQRYKTAKLDDLKQNELKALYPKTIDLTLSRINKAPHMSAYRLHRDLVKMLYYFGQVMAKNAKKQDIPPSS
jgi:enoyl-CoA hydratase/carnithine racemase